MKVLVIGPFAGEQRETSIARGFLLNKCDVQEHSYGDLLYSANPFVRAQFRLGVGPVFSILCRRIISHILKFKPDVLFFRRPLEFSAEMIEEVKSASSALVVSFNNDDPFSSVYDDRRWKSLRSAIPKFDLHFAFRKTNLKQLTDSGAKKVLLWEPFYSPWIHNDRFACSHSPEDFHLLFAMHAEKDERRDALYAMKNVGIPVNVHSWNWSRVFGKNDAANLQVHPPIWGDAYVKAISHAAGTLCFYSKQNNDEITTRVMEIPACLGLLLSWRTERVQEIFDDEQEAFFFSSTAELLRIVNVLKTRPHLVDTVKKNGMAKLLKSRHSIVDRCSDALDEFRKLIG